uniref:Uncharacterized protein n=1 Tax=Plectus sambesii TaxID=2011161 RepID=A0A914WF30_9BILA
MAQQANGGETQIDISQMFADVSRTVSGLKNIFGQGGMFDPTTVRLSEVSGAGDSSPVSSPLFGNTCLKACGMEDIQEAAKRTADMMVAARHALSSLETCIIVFTIVTTLCMLAISGTILFHVLCRLSRKNAVEPLYDHVRRTGVTGDLWKTSTIDNTYAPTETLFRKALGGRD